MDVKFVNTTSAKLSSLSVVNGQLIALSDRPGLSYDLGGVRRSLSLSDNYTSSAGTAASGVGASSYALAKVYDMLKDNLYHTSCTFADLDNTSLISAFHVYSTSGPYGICLEASWDNNFKLQIFIQLGMQTLKFRSKDRGTWASWKTLATI